MHWSIESLTKDVHLDKVVDGLGDSLHRPRQVRHLMTGLAFFMDDDETGDLRKESPNFKHYNSTHKVWSASTNQRCKHHPSSNDILNMLATTHCQAVPQPKSCIGKHSTTTDKLQYTMKIIFRGFTHSLSVINRPPKLDTIDYRLKLCELSNLYWLHSGWFASGWELSMLLAKKNHRANNWP